MPEDTTPTAATIVFPQLPAFVRDPAKPDNGSLWIKQVEIKFSLSANLKDIHKCALVSSVLDSDTFDRLSRALLPDSITTFADWKKFKDKFINLFDTKRSLFADRYNTFQIEWRGPAYETVQEYVARVRQSVSSFQFSDFKENELHTLVMLMGMKAAALEPIRSLVLNALIKTPKESLDTIQTLVDNALMTERDQKLPETSHVCYVKRSESPNNGSAASRNPPRDPCPSCDGRHWKADCPFKDATCHTCGRKGHISKVCKSGKKKKPQKRVNFLKINAVRFSSPNGQRRYMAPISISGINLRVQYDSAADITILSRNDYRRIGAPPLQRSTLKARAIDNTSVKFDGCFNETVTCGAVAKEIVIHVAAKADRSVLGLDFSNGFNVVLGTDSSVTMTSKVSPPADVISTVPSKSSPRIGNVRVSNHLTHAPSAAPAQTTIKGKPQESNNIVCFSGANEISLDNHTP